MDDLKIAPPVAAFTAKPAWMTMTEAVTLVAFGKELTHEAVCTANAEADREYQKTWGYADVLSVAARIRERRAEPVRYDPLADEEVERLKCARQLDDDGLLAAADDEIARQESGRAPWRLAETFVLECLRAGTMRAIGTELRPGEKPDQARRAREPTEIPVTYYLRPWVGFRPAEDGIGPSHIRDIPFEQLENEPSLLDHRRWIDVKLERAGIDALIVKRDQAHAEGTVPSLGAAAARDNPKRVTATVRRDRANTLFQAQLRTILEVTWRVVGHDPKKARLPGQLAKRIAHESDVKALNLSVGTIKQFLNGAYPPMKRQGIPGVLNTIQSGDGHQPSASSPPSQRHSRS